jgi:hypothetical protein
MDINSHKKDHKMEILVCLVEPTWMLVCSLFVCQFWVFQNLKEPPGLMKEPATFCTLKLQKK